MGFVAETSYNGIYAITEESITRYDRKGESESQGLLVRKHYDEIQNALLVAGIMKEGSTFESLARYAMSPDDLPEKAPRLDTCLAALERMVSLMTEGEYDEVVNMLSAETRPAASELEKHKYWGEMQEIYWHIKELREGKYIESDSLRYKGRRGIPRLSTTGARIFDAIVDMVWKMDGNLPNMWTYGGYLPSLNF